MDEDREKIGLMIAAAIEDIINQACMSRHAVDIETVNALRDGVDGFKSRVLNNDFPHPTPTAT